MRDKYTPNVRHVLAVAYELSEQMGQSYIGTEHLLIALTECDGVAKDILTQNGVKADKLIELAKQLIVLGGAEEPDGKDSFSPMARKVLLQSEDEAHMYGERLVGTEHLLLALLKEATSLAVRLLNTSEISVQKLFTDTVLLLGGDLANAKAEFALSRGKGKKRSLTPTVDQYSRDLTLIAEEGKLDPVVGRKKEMERFCTLSGPQRDEFVFTLNSKELRVFGSTGQVGISALLLKMTEFELVKTLANLPVIALIDDVTGELDRQNCDLFLNVIHSADQKIFTFSREEAIPDLGDIQRIDL